MKLHKGMTILGAAAFGAGAMFLLDPRGGRRRRALIKDQVTHAAHETEDFLHSKKQHLKNRAKGFAASARSVMRSLKEPAEPSCSN